MLTHLNESPTAPTRVVVMGAAGFVGGAVTRRLTKLGVSVLALGRADLDLLDDGAAERLAGLLRPDDAFVAVSARAPCKSAPMLLDNLRMAHTMTAALISRPVAHVINISSDAIFADSPQPLTEQSCASPGSYHGIMHLSRELMFRTDVQAPLCLLRPTLIYGTADPHNGYGPNQFRRKAAQGEEIMLFGEGEERRDHVLIDDVAEIVVRVLFRRSTGTLNIATGEVRSFRWIAERVVALSGRPVAIRSTPRRGPMPHNGYRPFDIAACRTAFPDFRYTLLEEGLAQVQQEMTETV